MKSQRRIPDILNRDQVRQVDQIAIRDYGIPGLILMENAGRNAAQLLKALGIRGRVVICCGKGNNGGDGFVMARHLENAGFDVRVLLCFPPESVSGDAKANLEILQKAGTAIAATPVDWTAELSAADWIVDALLGTGVQGSLREPFISVIDAINGSGRRVFAVDLPSGLDCDSGQRLGCCVRAQHTATFVASKPGFLVPGANHWTGQVHVIEIGVPISLLQRWV